MDLALIQSRYPLLLSDMLLSLHLRNLQWTSFGFFIILKHSVDLLLLSQVLLDHFSTQIGLLFDIRCFFLFNNIFLDLKQWLLLLFHEQD